MIENSIHWGLCALPRDLRVSVSYTVAHHQNTGEVINRGLGQKKEEKRNENFTYMTPLKELVLSSHCNLCSYCIVTQSCPTLCDPMDCSTPGFPVLHHLPEFAQTHDH